MGKITFKSLLIAAALCLGTSAWAEETTLYERGTTTAWSEADLTEWTASVEGPTSSINSGLAVTVAASGKAGHYSKSISPVSNTSILRLTAIWNPGNATGVKDNTNAYLSFGDVQFAFYGQNWYTNVTIGGVTTKLEAGYTRSRDYSIVVTINQATNEVTYSFTDNGKTVTGVGTTASAGSFTTLSHGLGGRVPGWDNTTTLKTIEITEETQTVTTANYTINYKLGENTIKTATASTVVGSTITAESVVYDENGERYLIEADEAPSLTIGSDVAKNVLNVTVRKPYTAIVNLVTTIAGEASEPVSKTFTETDDKQCIWSYCYSLYIKSGDVYYIADNTETFGEVGTFTNEQVINKEVKYTNIDNTVVAFAESGSNSGTNNSYSNGETAHIAAQNYTTRGTSLGTLPAGKYQFVVSIVANPGRQIVLRKAETGDEIVLASTTGLNTLDFTLTEETSLIYNGKTVEKIKDGVTSLVTNQSADYDYVLITKTGEATVSTTISAAGYSTFSSTNAVDFSAAEGLTAYTATVSENKVVLTAIENGIVPANTGVILKGAAGDYTGAVTTTETVIENNALVAATEEIASLATETTVDEVTYKNYILNVVNETPGFYQAAGKKVAAGKAYLQVPVEQASAAKTLTIVWNDGETTGIKDNYEFGIMNSDAATYDLSGRKVANPAKGLYIKNGKKFIVK